MSSVVCEIRNHVAFLTLNRPAALNALSLEMVIELHATLSRCATDPNVRAVLMRGAGEKAFCAGGDIRALYESFKSAGSVHRDFFRAEYPLDYMLHFYRKPYIALLDGITMGGGMGIAQGSRLRIVGDRTRMAMPEVAIGFFPDVGGSYFLSRLPGALGAYLGLTGVQIRAADALYTGLADAYLPRAAVDRLEAALLGLAWSNDPDADIHRAVYALASRELAAPPLAKVRPAIDLHFAGRRLAAVIESLRREERPEYVEWAGSTLALLQTRSPTMLAVTLRQLARGRSLSLSDCLRMEMGMAQQCLQQGDFIEGVRALIIDKDNAPRWRPSRIEDITDASVDAIFQDPWAGRAHPLANLEGGLIP